MVIIHTNQTKPLWFPETPLVFCSEWVFFTLFFLETYPIMAMALDAALWIAKMAWIALSGWISSCLTVADEFASSLRTGEIGPFHVGWSNYASFSKMDSGYAPSFVIFDCPWNQARFRVLGMCQNLFFNSGLCVLSWSGVACVFWVKRGMWLLCEIGFHWIEELRGCFFVILQLVDCFGAYFVQGWYMNLNAYTTICC